MALSLMRRWLHGKSSRRGRRTAGYRLRCEHLEKRDLLSTIRWTGNENANWANNDNWIDVDTGAIRSPQNDDDIVFPSDALNRTNVNNIGIVLQPRSISFVVGPDPNPANHGPYSISGNAIQLNTVSGVNGMTNVSNFVNAFGCNIVLAGTRVFSVTAGTLQLLGAISGAGGLTKGGGGQLELGGGVGNSFTGTVNVVTGTVLLNKTAGNAISGTSLVIGNVTALDTVRLLGDNQIADNTAVTFNTGGLLDLNNRVETIASLTMTGGRVEIGTGSLSVQGAITTNASSAESQINGSGTGRLALRPVAGNQQTINVAQGTATFDLVITARLESDVAGTGLNKIGDGVLTLSGPGTYDGLTTLGAGTLNIQNNTALGATSAGTTVASNAAFILQGGLSVAEPFTLAGISTRAALSAFSGGTNTLTGAITLTSNVTVNVSTGTTLVFSGVIEDGGGTFGITKIGGGTVVLPAGTTHGYDGGTVVSAGTLQVDGTSTSAVTVNSGGTLTGAGIINPAGAQALTVNSPPAVGIPGGVVSPGVAGVNGGIGTLTLDGNVTFNGLSEFHVQVSSTGGDSLRILGANRTVNLNRTVVGITPFDPVLIRSALDPIAGGTEFRVIERVDPTGAIITGRFQGLGANPSALTISGQAFFIGYTAGGAFNDIVLQRNTPPQVEYILMYPEVIQAGEYSYLVGQLTDPDPEDFQGLYIYWGDGSEDQIEFPGLEQFVYYHQYTEPGDYYVFAFWFDISGEGNFRVLPLTVLPAGAPGQPGGREGAAVASLVAAQDAGGHSVSPASTSVPAQVEPAVAALDTYFRHGDGGDDAGAALSWVREQGAEQSEPADWLWSFADVM